MRIDITEVLQMADEEKPEQPEKVLLLAILERAIRDCVGTKIGGCAARQHEEREAREWILDRSGREFGFEWVCEHLEFESSVTNFIRHIVQYPHEFMETAQKRLRAGKKVLAA